MKASNKRIAPAAGTPVTVTLIRHGATSAAAGTLLGQRDVAATIAGDRALTRCLRQHCGATTQLFTSPLSRCSGATLRYAARHAINCRVLEQLVEAGFGRWEGRTLDSIERRQPGTLLTLTSHPERLVIPGGEPFTAFRERVRAAWRHVLGSEATDIVVVTHAGVIRALLADVLNLDWAHAQRVALPLAGACRIVVHPDGVPVVASLGSG